MRVVQLTTVAMSLRFLEGHIRFLRERQVEVHAISSPSAELDAFAERNGVPTHAVEIERRISPLRDLRSLWQLVRLLRELRPEIVHAHTPKAGLLGMLAARLARVPVRGYHIHGLPLMTASGLKRTLLRACDRVACSLADQVYCVSHSLRRVVEAERICTADKMAVLANGSISGIDAAERFNPDRYPSETRDQVRAEFGIPARARVIGFVGRIVRDKGIHELLEAWRQLREQFDDVHLLLVGPVETGDAISAEAKAMLRDEPAIHCAGYQSETARYFLAMDVLAFPTYREGFGLVATEAAAMCVPVVATQITGCVDAVIDGVTGTLVPARDGAALAEAIRCYLDDSELRQQHGAAGRVRVLRDFQPRRIETAQWDGYQKLLLSKGLGRVFPLPERRRHGSKAA